MPEESATRIPLSGGSEALLTAAGGGWILEVDGVRQSALGPAGAEPPLAVTRWMRAAVGEGDALDIAHLGGGLLSLPRALAQARPGSRQVVVESEPGFVELARTVLPAPAGVDVRQGDARAWLAEAPRASLDAIAVDVFAGGRVPPAFGSAEFHGEAAAALRPGGVLVVNSVAGGGLGYLRRQLASLRAAFAHVALIVQGSALGGLRFGNAVLVASAAPLAAERIRVALRGDPSKGALVTDLDPLVGDATPIAESEGLWSPEPDLPDPAGALAAVERVRGMLGELLTARDEPRNAT